METLPLLADPKNPESTHHIVLKDREGRSLGLMLVDSKGAAVSDKFAKKTIDRTSLKTVTGNMTYGDFRLPYSPIAQDNWEGGRGNLDFERDATKFRTSKGINSSRSNHLYLAGQEQYSTGFRSKDENVPADVKWYSLLANAAGAIRVGRRFVAGGTYTATATWLQMRYKGEPGAVYVGIWSDTAGDPNAEIDSTTIAYTDADDVLAEWLEGTVSAALTSGTTYWLIVYGGAGDDSDNHWKVATNDAVGNTYTSIDAGSNWVAATFDLYYRITDADVEKDCILFPYREQVYRIISPSTGAPKLEMNGDRGQADSNAGNLDRLVDATKSGWVNDAMAGGIVLLIDGPGLTEQVRYRTITGSSSGYCEVSPSFNIEHTAATEYVILGVDAWQEITGHGLTGPVTDVFVSSKGVVYMAQGDSIVMRRMKVDYAGTDNHTCAADGTNKATFIIEAPQQQKMFIVNNRDGSSPSDVSYATSPLKDWGSDLVYSAAVPVGDRYILATGINVHVDYINAEAVWVGKEDRPWIIPQTGNPFPFYLKEMETVRSEKNFVASLVQDVYMFFSLGNGVQRWYSTDLQSVGPNVGEGLPENMRGPVVAMLGLPSRYLQVVDAGSSGYSSILVRDSGQFEIHRGPKGQRIKAIHYQVIPGDTTLDRLWVAQGNEMIWLPFPSEGMRESEISDYPYVPEGAIEISRMHSGMIDTQKLVKSFKLIADNLDGTSWVEGDYKVDGDTAWLPFPDIFNDGPIDEILFDTIFGIAGKRLYFRLRFYTNDRTVCPDLEALVVGAVSIVEPKGIYAMPVRIADNDKNLLGKKDPVSSEDKLELLALWAGPENKSMLYMTSIESGYDKRMVFLPASPWSLRLASKDENDKEQYKEYICSLVVQDA